MSETLNSELMRLTRTDQFTSQTDCLRLIEDLRLSYMDGLENLRTIERRIMASGLIPPKDED